MAFGSKTRPLSEGSTALVPLSNSTICLMISIIKHLLISRLAQATRNCGHTRSPHPSLTDTHLSPSEFCSCFNLRFVAGEDHLTGMCDANRAPLFIECGCPFGGCAFKHEAHIPALTDVASIYQIASKYLESTFVFSSCVRAPLRVPQSHIRAVGLNDTSDGRCRLTRCNPISRKQAFRGRVRKSKRWHVLPCSRRFGEALL